MRKKGTYIIQAKNGGHWDDIQAASPLANTLDSERYVKRAGLEGEHRVAVVTSHFMATTTTKTQTHLEPVA